MTDAARWPAHLDGSAGRLEADKGQAMLDELARYQEAKQSAAASLRTMNGLLQDGTPMDAVIGNLARCLADQLDTPLPFSCDGPHQPVTLPAGCYDASFGRVHVRPGCRC
jgi:hypothetical protein